MKREPKPDDLEKVNYAVQILADVTEINSHIEPTLWIVACGHFMAQSFIYSKINFNEFCEVLDEFKEHYKSKFEEAESK